LPVPLRSELLQFQNYNHNGLAFTDKSSLTIHEAKFLAEFIVDGFVLGEAVDAQVLDHLRKLPLAQVFTQEFGDFF